MSEEQDSQDKSQKTEEATARQLEKAREKGQLAFSKEINHWMIIFGLFLTVSVVGPPALEGVVASLKPLLKAGEIPSLEPLQLMALLQEVMIASLQPVSLVFLVFIIAGLVAGLGQTQFLISFENIKPKLSKLSVFQGLKRIFSPTALFEFFKGMLKIVMVSVIFMMILVPDFYRLNRWGMIPVGRIFEIIQDNLSKLLIVVLALLGFIAGFDYLYQRFMFRKNLRMSKQEIKEEHKEAEGDPAVKRRLSELRRERAMQQRVAVSVPTASVVITNPTHYAIALKYEDGMSAPKCVAKGVDMIAQNIRTLAEENDVPILEDPPLARALYAGVEVDQEVPEKYYMAVARVIRFIMGLDKSYRGVDLDDDAA